MTVRDKVVTMTQSDMTRKFGSIHYGYPDSWNNPVETAVQSQVGHLPLLEYKTSYSTPGWNKVEKQTFLVPVARKSNNSKPPAVPRYLPPKFPLEPKFRPKTSAKNRERIMRRYLAKVRLYRLEKLLYDDNYARRIAKFYIRLAKYTAHLTKTYFRKMKKVRKTVHRAAVNHPYTMTRVINSGMSGYYIDRQEIVLVAYGPSPGMSYSYLGPSQNTYSVRAFGGYLGDDFYGMPDMVSPALGLFYPVVGVPSALVLASDDKAVSKVFQLLNSQELHVAQIIAERHQTIDLVLGSAKRLAAFIKHPLKVAQKYLFDSTRNQNIRNLANDHLLYSFGVEPLVADCYAAAEQLARIIHQKPSDKVVVHARALTTDLSHTSTVWSSFTDYHVVKTQVKTSYVLEYHIDNPVSAELQAFGLVNPAEVAWELTPWSFVIDWFLPIGSYITSLTADMGLSFVTGTKTVKITTTYESHRDYINGYLPGSPGRSVYGKIEGSRITETIERTVLTEPPVPRLPKFKNPFSQRHIGLSLALLIQKIKK